MQVGSLAGDSQTAVELHVLVSNQSYADSRVDIDVFVDDVHVIAGDFDVDTQHTWHRFDFRVEPGAHRLRAVASGEVALDEMFEVDAERWGVLEYWFDGGEEPAYFSWRTEASEPLFR